MKNSIPAIIFLLIFIGLKFDALAQKTPSPVRPHVSLGAEFAFPVDKEFSNMFTVGFGGSGRLDIPVTAALYATASAGFISFYAKDRVNGTLLDMNNKSYVPLKAGAKYYLSPIIYAQGEVGASIGVQKSSGASLILAPAIGAIFPITKKGFLNADIRFENWNRDMGNLNHFALRAAYQF